jgi:NADH-quinone oxidoreductase subunit M
VQDLRPRELALLCVSALIILGFGVFPNRVLETNRASVEAWLTHLMDQPVLENKNVRG